MKTKLSSALGLALLAVSLTFTSSFACSNSRDEQTSIVNAAPSEVAQSPVAEIVEPPVTEAVQSSAAEVADPPAAVAEAAELPLAETALPSSAFSENEPSATEASSPMAIYAVDAIKVEVTQTMTIAASGQNLEDDQPAYTGSIGEEATPPALQSAEAIVVEGGQTVSVVVPRESAEEEQSAYTGANATEIARSTADETPTEKPDLLPDENRAALGSNEP